MSGRRLVVEADGGSRGNPGPAGYGAVVRDADTGEVLRQVAGGIGRATNNVAEYQGLLAGLRAAAELDPTAVEVRMDSKLVVEQMAGRWQVKHPAMRALRVEAAEVVRRLPSVRFRHVRRELNGHADRLANEAMDAAAAGRTWRPPEDRGDRTPALGRIAVAPGAETFPTVGRSAGAAGPAAAAAEVPGWGLPATTPTRTLLLRHGATALSAEKRFSGIGDVPLAGLGRAQARATAERLAATGQARLVAVRLAGTAAPTAVVTSPLLRARETAEIVSERLQVPIAVAADLREADFGDWEGATFAEVQEKWPNELAEWLADPAASPPGGESFTDATVRVRAALDRLLADHRAGTVLVVTHVTPIKTLVRLALDAPPSALYRMHLDPGGLSTIDWYADGPAVLRLLNDTSHLTGLDPER